MNDFTTPPGFSPVSPRSPSPPFAIRALVDEIAVINAPGGLAVVIIAKGLGGDDELIERIAVMLDEDDIAAIARCAQFIHSEGRA
jgi:hypothetical protein